MRLFVRVCLVFNRRKMRGSFEMEKNGSEGDNVKDDSWLT